VGIDRLLADTKEVDLAECPAREMAEPGVEPAIDHRRLGQEVDGGGFFGDRAQSDHLHFRKGMDVGREGGPENGDEQRKKEG